MKKIILGLGLVGILGVNAFAYKDNYTITQNMATRYKMELSSCYSVLKDAPSQAKYFGGIFKKTGRGLDGVADTSYNEETKKLMLSGGYNMINKGSSGIVRDSAQLVEIGFLVAGGLKNGLDHIVVDQSEENEIERKNPNVSVIPLNILDTGEGGGTSGSASCDNIYVVVDKELTQLYLDIVRSYGGFAYFNGSMSSYKIGPLLMNVEPLKITAGGYTIYSNDSDAYLGYTFTKGNAFMKNKK